IMDIIKILDIRSIPRHTYDYAMWWKPEQPQKQPRGTCTPKYKYFKRRKKKEILVLSFHRLIRSEQIQIRGRLEGEMTSGVEDDKNRSVATDHQHQQPHPPPFQGVSNYPPPPQQQQPPAGGFPQPAQPYVSGYAVNGGMHSTEHHRLPCCGIGIGWLLFILGFFFGAIPWYIGFFLLLFSRNRRERPGYMACAIGAVIATILIVFGAIRGSGVWS
ncbi:unnamed protein product, partial [Thlaspi arvense]